MRAGVQVLTPQAFQAWLASQKGSASPPIGSPPAGAQVPTAASGGAPASASSSSASSSSPSSGASIAAGKALFAGAAGCGGCHTLAAAGTTGTVGPNLSQRLASDCRQPASIKARGATLTQCITTSIEHPYAYIPSGYHPGIMPANFAQTLTASQLQSLVSFLVSVTK
jgi:cytochrome c oxidase subunit 2